MKEFNYTTAIKDGTRIILMKGVIMAHTKYHAHQLILERLADLNHTDITITEA